MSSPEPHIDTTPPWLEPAPPRVPLSRRRKLLLGAVGVLVVALVLATFALNAVLEARLPKSVPAAAGGTSASDIADCSKLSPKWIGDWVTSEKAPIAQAYNSQMTGTAQPWQTPDGFPVAAFAWAQTTPACGNIIRLSDGKTIWAYRLDVDSATRKQFDGISTLLSAMGYLMVSDEVPLDQIGQDDSADSTDSTDSSGGASPTPTPTGTAATSLYREFSARDGRGDLQITLFTSDLTSDTASGELLIDFSNHG